MKRVVIFLAVVTLTSTIATAQLLSTKAGKISFFSNSPLEDIEAKNYEVESKLLGTNGQVVFTLLVKGFRFENQLMEDHFNESYLESSKFPKADFKGFITNLNEVNFTKDGNYPAKVKGSLTIHGVTKEVETPGTISVKGGKVTANTKFDIKLKDYNISGGMIGKKIAENISITVNCQYE